MPESAIDYEHLQSCVEKDCWYCCDRPEPKTIVDRFVEKFDALDEAA